jgi:hypothetical protein
MGLPDYVNEYFSGCLIDMFVSYDIWALGKRLGEERPSLLSASRWRDDDLIRYKAITDDVSCYIRRIRPASLCQPALAIVLVAFQALSLGMTEQHQTQHCTFHNRARA